MHAFHVSFLLFLGVSAAVYDFQRTSVYSLNQFNFDKQVSKPRNKLAALIHYYREHDGKSHSFVDEINALAKDWQGAFIVGAINCDEHESLCEDHDVRHTPILKVFPPLPAPTHEYEGEKTSKALVSYLSSYLSPKVSEVTSDSVKSFTDVKPGTPKVLLFTEKAGVPTIYKALSNTLGDTLDFGIVRSDQSTLVNKYKVTSFPTLVLVKTTEAKPKIYEGEMKYRKIFEFLNIYSEVFIVADSTGTAPTPKPWKSELVPELTQASSSDVCFSKEGFICAIFITNAKPTNEQIELFKSLQGKFTSQIEGRGVDITFMWLNGGEETQFVDSLEGVSAPALVYLKHGSKNRFMKHVGMLSESGIENAVAKIMGGDGKFTNIKGKFPRFNPSRK